MRGEQDAAEQMTGKKPNRLGQRARQRVSMLSCQCCNTSPSYNTGSHLLNVSCHFSGQLAQKMFGQKALHVQNPERDANLRREIKLKKEGKQPMNRAARRKQLFGGVAAHQDLNAPQQKHKASFKGRANGRPQDARFPPADPKAQPQANNRPAAHVGGAGSAKRSAPAASGDVSSLHPSWAAKKLQQESLQKANFQGKKIKFDDEE